MALRLADLLADESLRLRLRAGDVDGARDVTWVHVIDVPDPSRWLEGGEVVLTTGLGLVGRGAGDLRAYVTQLAERGIAALGFGTGVTVDDVPAALLAAADDTGLPLFEVPIDVPFVAVTRAVADRLAAQRYHRVEQAVDTQQRITRAAVGKGAPGVLATLVRHVPGWGLVTDAGGRVLASAPDGVGTAARAAQVRAALAGRSAGPLGLVVDLGDGHLAVQSLGAGPRPRGYLAVCTPATLSDPERLVVNHAASLVSLELEKSDALRRTERRMRADVLATVLDGGLTPARAGTHLSALGFGDDVPSVVVLLTADQALLPDVGDRVETGWVDDDRPVAVVVRAEGVVLLLGDADGAALATVERVLKENDDLPVQGAGASAPVAGRPLRVAVREAAAAAAVSATASATASAAVSATASTSDGTRTVRARSNRGWAGGSTSGGAGGGIPSLARFDDLPVMSLLVGSQPPDRLRVVVDTLLGPLREYDAAADGDLVRSLRAYLDANARWEDAAAALQVHRHTLRYRMAKVEALTGRTLASARHRAEFWFALEAAMLIDPPETPDEAGSAADGSPADGLNRPDPDGEPDPEDVEPADESDDDGPDGETVPAGAGFDTGVLAGVGPPAPPISWPGPAPGPVPAPGPAPGGPGPVVHEVTNVHQQRR